MTLTDKLVQVSLTKFGSQFHDIKVVSGLIGCRAASVVIAIGATATACLLLWGAASTTLGGSRRATSRLLLSTILGIFDSLSAVWPSVNVDIKVAISVLDEGILGRIS